MKKYRQNAAVQSLICKHKNVNSSQFFTPRAGKPTGKTLTNSDSYELHFLKAQEMGFLMICYT